MSRGNLYLLLSLIFILGYCTFKSKAAIPLAPPVPAESVTTTYYDIVGASENELRTQLDALGPVSDIGYKGWGITRWVIYWSWPGLGSDSCDLSAATVSYKINIVLPRWTPPENVSQDLLSKWRIVSYALVEHENGHADYVVENYKTVLDAIKNSTCGTANLAADRVLESIRQHDVDYDNVTNHGATQGVIFN